jgi:arsenate reductase
MSAGEFITSVTLILAIMTVITAIEIVVEYGLDDTDPAAVTSLPGLLSMRVYARKALRPPVPLLGLFMVLAVGAALSMALAQNDRSTGATPGSQKQPMVLFMCPHGAAKSVLASAYFQRIAKERGLNVRVDAVGVEPQDTVSLAVADHLQRNGYTVPVTKPRAVTKEDLEQADVVISMGCDVTQLPAAPRTLQQWDDVPGPSEDFKGADEAIRRRVIALVEELVARQGK